MVMGEVSLCRVKELPPVIAGELRPALADESAGLFVDRVPHESVVRLWPVTAVPDRSAAACSWSVAPGGHAPEKCHGGVGKPVPERCQPGARACEAPICGGNGIKE